jgi:DNA-binding CsgD family transcriptional regulator
LISQSSKTTPDGEPGQPVRPDEGAAIIRARAFLIVSLACFYVAELGRLVDLCRLGYDQYSVTLLGFFAAFPITFLLVRQMPALPGSKARQKATAVLLVLAAVTGCLNAFVQLSVIDAPALLTPLLSGICSLVSGVVCCLGMLACYSVLPELGKEPGMKRPLQGFIAALMLGLGLTFAVLWLEDLVRIVVFNQTTTIGCLIMLLSSRQLQLSQNLRQMASANPKRVPMSNTDAQESISVESINAQPIHLNRYTHFTMFSFLLALSFCIGIAGSDWNPLTASLAVAFTVCVGLGYKLLSRRAALGLGEMGKVALPTIIALLFCVIPGVLAINALVLIAAAAFFMVFETMNAYWLARTALLFGLDSFRHIASGRLPLASGTLCGLLLGTCARQALLALDSASHLPLATLILSGIVAVCVVTTYTFLPFNQGTPVKEGILQGNLRELNRGERKSSRPFKARCNAFAVNHGLTAREQEVLFLLACGYNSETIAGLLIVSANTARTHISRIYQKTGLHSQQELMRHLEKEHHTWQR